MIQSKRPRLEDFGDTITKPAIQGFTEEITKPTLAAMPQLSKDDGGTGGNGGQDVVTRNVGNIDQSDDLGEIITEPAIQEFTEDITKPRLAAMPQLSKDDGGTGGNGGQDVVTRNVGNIYQSNDLQSYKVQDTVKDECELNDIFIDRLKKEAEKQFKGELLRTFFKKLSNYSEEVCVFFQLTQNIYLQ